MSVLASQPDECKISVDGQHEDLQVGTEILLERHGVRVVGDRQEGRDEAQVEERPTGDMTGHAPDYAVADGKRGDDLARRDGASRNSRPAKSGVLRSDENLEGATGDRHDRLARRIEKEL